MIRDARIRTAIETIDIHNHLMRYLSICSLTPVKPDVYGKISEFEELAASSADGCASAAILRANDVPRGNRCRMLEGVSDSIVTCRMRLYVNECGFLVEARNKMRVAQCMPVDSNGLRMVVKECFRSMKILTIAIMKVV